MKKKITALFLIALFFFMPGGIIAQISQLSSNDRVCGTPSIPFNEKNIVNLALKNQNLPKANQLKEIKKFIV